MSTSPQELSNSLIRVAEVFNTTDANILKGILEDMDIFCLIEGEHFSNLGMTVPSLGVNIFLKIIKKDLDRAIPAIKDFKTNTGFDIRLLIDTA